MLNHIYDPIYLTCHSTIMHATMTQNYFNKALKYYNNQKTEKAKKYALKNIKLNPSHIDSLKLVAYIEFQQKHFKKSLIYLNTAFKLNPNLSEINNLIGCIYLEYGEIEKGAAYFTRCIEIRPTYADAYINLIISYQKLAQTELASHTFEKGIRHLNNNEHFQLRGAKILSANKQFTHAIEIYQHLLANDTSINESAIGLSKCYLGLHDVESVLSILKSLNGASSQSANTRMDISNELLHHGYEEQAIEEYHSLIGIFPDTAALYNNIATAFDHLEETDKAIEYYEKSIFENKDYVPAKSNYGRVLTDINQLDKAEIILQQALKIEPDNVNALVNLGRMYEIKGEPNRSLEILMTALKLSPRKAIIHSNLGNAYHQLGDFKKSRHHYQVCLSLDPNYEDAEQNLGINELAMGKFETAWGHYFRRIRHLEHGETLSTIIPGMSLKGKRVYFCRSQGIGDEIFFLRFLRILKAQSLTVFYRSSKKLYPLLKDVAEIDVLIDEDGDIPDCDYYFTIDDLPLLLNINNINKITESLRLTPNANKIREIEKKLASHPRPYIGITWRAGTQATVMYNKEKQRNLNKQIPMEEFENILHPMDGTIIILQRNPNENEMEKLKKMTKLPIIDFSDLNNSLEDMLALLSVIDIHFGVSSTNMHLHAAIGKRADVLVPFPPDWRWMTVGDASPWFPTFGVFRQEANGSWKQAQNGLMKSLEDHASR